MAIYLELPVYKTCNELYVAFVKIRRTLPREERYTIGMEIDRAMVGVLVLLQRINSTRDKVPLIVKARQLVAEIQVRVRALRDVQALSIKRFVTLFDLSESVSKQLSSWQKFSQRAFDAKVPSGGDGRPESAGSRSCGACQRANPMKESGDLTASMEATS